jgi:hypothetical protein
MARSPEFEIGSATALILAEEIGRLELAQIPVCPEPGPAQSAAQQAHARACLGVAEEFHLLLGAFVQVSRETRH